MVERIGEEHIDLDRLNDGVSEIRPYKSKQAIAEEKEERRAEKEGKKVQKAQENQKKELKSSSIVALMMSIVFFVVVVGYSVVAFGHIPFVEKWRNIWIETAMTTDQHKWLAQSFFPKWLIDDVMSRQVDIKDMSITGDFDPNKDMFGGIITLRCLWRGSRIPTEI